MATTSGVSEQIISLPKGGGALSGLGEKFSPDLFTGTGNVSVPIEVPSGRNDLQPDLRLTYSTGNGNGLLGLGWQLNAPGVRRKTADGVPIYDDDADTFVLSGAEDLVAVDSEKEETASGEHRTRYRPRTEGLFARIVAHRSPTSDYWRVRAPDGLVSTYGTPEARGDDPATVADPADPENVFTWRLTETRDTFGNRVVYEYGSDTGTDGPHRWDRPLLERIRYVDVGDDDPEFLVTVSFEYEDRPDPFSTYRSGFEVRTTKRCKRILVRTHADQERLVRSYAFTYLDERGRGDERHQSNGSSLLVRIDVAGHDGDDTEALPPLTFDYSSFDPDGRDFFPLKGDLPSRSLADPNTELIDLFGNGLPDVVRTGDTVRYWRNVGDGRFARPRTMDAAPTGLRLADQGVQLVDADGDGRPDLLATTGKVSGYYPLGTDGEWDADAFQRYETAPSIDLEGPSVALVDLDGDGVTDAVRSGSRFECFFSDPDAGWDETKRVARKDIEAFPDVDFADERVRWADCSGDGLQDVVLIHDGSVAYWPNLGHGEWGARVQMRASPHFPSGYEPRRVLMGDVDGDGLADLVYVEDDRVLLWLNQYGDRWSKPIEIDGTPSVTDDDAVRLVDLLGTGVKGLLWNGNARSGTDRSFFLDFTGGTKPSLLTEMDNHTGALTRIEYAPSTVFYLADEGRPETRWDTTLPFPVQVVSRVESIDAISEGKLTTAYQYHHGYWDGAEREFRGFGMVEQADSESFEDYNDDGLHGEGRSFTDVGSDDREQFSSPTVTKTWFHQGPVGPETGDWREPDYSEEYWDGDPPALSRSAETVAVLRSLPRRDSRDALRTLRGHVLRQELYARDGSDRADRPYTVTERLHGVREEAPQANGDQPGTSETDDPQRIFFPHELGTRTTQWERGDDPKTKCTFVGSYDDYGQPRSEIGIAVPQGRDFREPAADGVEVDPYVATCTVTDYARRDDESTYIVDREARSTTYEVENDGRDDIYSLRHNVEQAVEARTLPDAAVVAQRVNFYDGEAFRGGDFGTVGDHGALVRTERLALTDEILQDVYEADDVASTPPYLTMGAGTEWTDYPASFRGEYPQAFAENLPSKETIDLSRPGLRITPAGYGVADGDGDSPYVPGHFVADDRRAYDFQTGSDGEERGLLTVQRDELGGETTIEYDDVDLLPTRVEDTVGLVTTASYDYCVFEPIEVTDPNGNRRAAAYTPLGLPERIAVMGGEGDEVGDTLAQPGVRYDYDLGAFDEGGKPISVETIRRETHRWDLLAAHPGTEPADLFPPDELERFPDRFVRTRDFSDGFGRVVQTRTQAEDIVFGDETVGGEALLVDQAVLVRGGEPDGERPDEIEDILGDPIGAETGTTGARLVRTLLRKGDGQATPVEQSNSAREAVDALEDGTVDAVVLDEAVALEFETRRPVSVAVTTGPGEVFGHESADSDRPRVVVSGWQTFDNKGQVVEQYEPFFDRGFAFRSRDDATVDDRGDWFNRRTRTHYDPRGQAVRTVEPDGSTTRTVYGVPDRLGDPDEFEPSPWTSFTYDANDNAGRTHGTADAPDAHRLSSEAYDHHWNTPTSKLVDALGRTVEVTERTRERAGDEPVERSMRTAYDVRGNPLEVTDALGRAAFRHAYDLRDEPLRAESIDAGTRVTVLDAAGNELERRDSKGALILQAFDELGRQRRLWACDATAEPLTLRERLVYGDDPEVDGASRNLLGELYRHYDEAGLLTVERLDFKDNVLAKRRQVLADDAMLAPTPIDWQPPDGRSLDDHARGLLASHDTGEGGDDQSRVDGYVMSYAYDGLDRPITARYPADVDGDRKELRPRYNRAGDLERVELVSRPGTSDEERKTYVEHVAYDATGQRIFIAYGNGVMTRYDYDPETFRLVRMRTDEYETPAADAYQATETVLQDYAYEYDLAGNVTTIRDRTPESGILDSPLGRDALDKEFEYDPLYQLVSATGRECGSAATRKPWDGRPRCADLARTRPYTEEYRYDSVGNLTELAHASGARERDRVDDGQFTRRLSVASETNRLTEMAVGQTRYDYDYDENGNLRQEGAGRHLEWNHRNRLRGFRAQVNDDDPSVHAHYCYNADGRRVKKLVEKGGTRLESTVSIGGVFEHHRLMSGDERRENDTLHVMDDERRIATVRVGESFPDDATPPVKFTLHDRLNSATTTVDGTGSIVDREEYTPYGETSFGSFARKRYRFIGVERDGESGLSYHGARYYAPWLARWSRCDPKWLSDGPNGYVYASNSPLTLVDVDGRQPTPPGDEPNTLSIGITFGGDVVVSPGSNTWKERLAWMQSALGQEPTERVDPSEGPLNFDQPSEGPESGGSQARSGGSTSETEPATPERTKIETGGVEVAGVVSTGLMGKLGGRRMKNFVQALALVTSLGKTPVVDPPPPASPVAVGAHPAEEAGGPPRPENPRNRTRPRAASGGKPPNRSPTPPSKPARRTPGGGRSSGGGRTGGSRWGTARRIAGKGMILLAAPEVLKRSFMTGTYLRMGEWEKAGMEVAHLVWNLSPLPLIAAITEAIPTGPPEPTDEEIGGHINPGAPAGARDVHTPGGMRIPEW